MLRCFVIITLSTGQLSVLTRALVNPVGKHTVFSAVSSAGEDASLHLAGSPTPLLRLLAHLFAGDLVTGGTQGFLLLQHFPTQGDRQMELVAGIAGAP
jgi:hypothetical protein